MGKKIMHLALSTGGVKTYVAHVLDHADPKRFEFVVIAPPDQLFEQFCRERQVRYYRVDLNRGLSPAKVVRNLWLICSAIRKERPGLLHGHSAMGGFLGRLAGRITRVPVIYTPHAFSYLSFTGPKRAAFYLLEHMAKRWATTLLAISHSEANTAIYELGYPPAKVQVVPNAIPIADTIPVTKDTRHVQISMIGRLTAQKNPLQFLEIVRQLTVSFPQAHFSILGAGIHDDLKTEVEQYVYRHGLADSFTLEKWGDAHTGQFFLKRTDIYISTSIFEGLPFSLLEAMQLGIPCVVSKVPGNTDVIQHGENGYACLSTEEFCLRIATLIEDKELRRSLGQAAVCYVAKHHNITLTVAGIEAVYNSISAH